MINIGVLSFQDIKELEIINQDQDSILRLSKIAIAMIKHKIEKNEFMPTIITMKKENGKFFIIEGRHIVEGIKAVKKKCDNWYEKCIPVMIEDEESNHLKGSNRY